MSIQIRFENLGQSSGVSEMHFDSFPVWAKWCTDVANGVTSEERGLIFADGTGGGEAVRHMTNSHLTDVTGLQVISRIERREVKSEMKRRIDSRLDGLKVDVETQYEEVEAMSLYNDECGLMLDATAYFSGEESCMINMDFTSTTKPVIWLAETLAMNGSFTDDNCANKGAALIAIIRACEMQAISVGIVGYSTTNEMNGYTVTLKQPSDYLDEAMLINLFCDRDALNTLDFCTDAYIKNSRVTGGVRTMTDECLYRGFSGAHNIVKIPCENQGNYNSLEQAMDFYKKSVKKATGVEIK